MNAAMQDSKGTGYKTKMQKLKTQRLVTNLNQN